MVLQASMASVPPERMVLELVAKVNVTENGELIEHDLADADCRLEAGCPKATDVCRPWTESCWDLVCCQHLLGYATG